MRAGIIISMEEYLDTAYSPDREYVDGVIVERHVGERGHSLVQCNFTVALKNRYPNVFVWPEWRVRTLDGRCRISDVCVTLEDPGTEVLEIPPLLAIEILSRRDEMTEVLEKLEEYWLTGVRNIWLIDPRKKKAFTFTADGLKPVTDPELATDSPEIRVTLAEVFRGL